MPFGAPERVGRPGVVQPSLPQGLVGVDVADAGDQRLVEQRPLDVGTPAAQCLDDGIGVVRGLERVRCDMTQLGRQVRTAVADRHAAEGPLVDEPQLTAVDEAEPDAQVELVRRGGGLHQELAGHAEVGQQRVLVVERQPQELAAAPRRGQGSAAKPLGEVDGAGDVAADRAGCEDVDIDDLGVEDVAFEALSDDLNLGELGHGSLLRAYDADAASSSASPSPSPKP